VIGKGLPMTYIFEGMRKVLSNGLFSWRDFGMNILLNFVYLVGTMCLFWFFFEKSRAKGLARLE